MADQELPDAANTTDNCWLDAGNRYQIDPYLLYAIAEVESAQNPIAINDKNQNGSRDIGLMQINSFWLPILAEHEIYEESLFDPCTSIFVGAWVLAQSIEVFGNTWRAVGAYNAGTGRNEQRERLRKNYAREVRAIYMRLRDSGGLRE